MSKRAEQKALRFEHYHSKSTQIQREFSHATARRGYVDNTVTTNDDGLVVARIKHKTRVANHKFNKMPRARTEGTIRTKPTQ